MFKDSERLVFRYDVAGETRFADPLVIRRALLRESAGQFYEWWESSAEPQEKPKQPEKPIEPGGQPGPEHVAYGMLVARWMSAFAHDEKCVPCIRAAFELAPFDKKTGSGVTESECWRILGEFHRWLEKNEKPGEHSPSTSPADSPQGQAGS